MGRVFFNTRKDVHALDGAYTMLESDSGKIFMLSATGGTVAITLLPAASLVKGWHCKFVVEEDTPSNASNSTAGTAVSNLIVGATATQGDMINIFCDGSTYYAECLSAIDDAVTTS